MTTVATKQIRVGGMDLEAVLAEAAGFSSSKYAGFEDIAHKIGVLAGGHLGLNEAFEFGLAFSEAEAVSTELLFAAGLDKNINFGLKLTPFAVPGMISIARPVLYGWLEYVLGGSNNEEIVYPEREPTELELRIGQLFCRFLCDALLEAFAILPAPMSAEILMPDAEAELGRWIRRDAQFGLTYEATLGSITGGIMIVLPVRMLDTLRTAETKPVVRQEPLPDPQWGAMLAKSVNTTMLDMVAVLGHRQITLDELAQLQVGQVVSLETGPRDPLTVEAADKPVFSALLGRTNGRYTLKFERMLETEDLDELPS